MEMTQCNTCFGPDGYYERCPQCGGKGVRQGGRNCPTCDGAGEVLSTKPCPVCGGQGEISLPLMRLKDADKYFSLNHPEIKGDIPEDHTYSTQESLAAWYRMRGHTTAREVFGTISGNDDYIVGIRTNRGTYRFRGLSWGYGGEGPHGLATILADIGSFDSEEAAIDWVMRQPQGKGWVLPGGRR